MESPFANTNSSVVMYLEPYLNSYYKSYQNIITFSDMPTGPLADMVSMISAPKLSPFQQSSPFTSNVNNCMYVLLRYPVSSGRKHGSCIENYMGVEDIPSVFSFLQSNGYVIEDGLTRMIQRGGFGISNSISNRRTICMFSYSI